MKIGLSVTELCLKGCLNSVAVYTAAALSPKHAFVARAPPSGGKAVVGVLMMAYKGPINLFSYSKLKTDS